MRTRYAIAIGAAALCCLTACSSELTEDDIRERVADAQRDAQTFTFEWTSSQSEDSEESVTTGELKYESGELTALELHIGEGEEYRLVDNVMYRRGVDGKFEKVDEKQRSQIIGSWDFAKAIEDYPLKNVSRGDEEDVNGVEATAYEVETEEDTFTWWIDEDDRLVKWKGAGVTATLHDYGEPVDISSP